MESKISKAIDEYATQHSMGCLLHDWIEYREDDQHGWAGYCDYDDEGNEGRFITMHLIGEDNAIHIFGIGPDGGHGAFYGTVIIN